VDPSGSVVVAVAEGEAVWLGFQAVDRARPALVRVRVDADGTEPLDALTGRSWSRTSPHHLTCPPDFCLAGIRRGEVSESFGQTVGSRMTRVVQRLVILARAAPSRTGQEAAAPSGWDAAASVRLVLVRPALFQRLTGTMPTPLDETAAYGGWRLP
jgi:hypothetical protein